MSILALLGLQNSAPQTTIPLTLLYDSIPTNDGVDRIKSIDAKPFYILYQSCDPQSYKSGDINIYACLKAIEKETSGNPPLFAMLDFEDPFTSDLQKGFDSVECKRALKAMIDLVRAVKIKYPFTKWSYYGVPYLPYWLEGHGWSTATHATKRSALERSIAIYSTLIEELDWISPSIYLKYDPILFPENQRGNIVLEGRAWREAQIRLAVLMGKGKSVIPTACPYWTPGGKANFCSVVSSSEFMDDQIVPAVSAGASGIAIWTAIQYFIGLATTNSEIKSDQEKDFGRAEWRSAFTKDYFANEPPKDWTSPEVKYKLLLNASDTIISSLVRIRDWETKLKEQKK